MIRILCLVIGYAFGLFQTSYIIGKRNGIDIREHGSGNAGTTNMLRTLGRKAGIITFLGDCFKCVIAVALVRLLFGGQYSDIKPLLAFYTATGVIMGHNFPFYLGFRGGKGIAATAGLGLAFDPFMALMGLLAFLAAFLTTHYVSLGSILVYVGILIELPILGQMGYFGMSQAHLNEMYLVAVFLAAMAFWKHKDNIKRILAGTERKTYLSKKRPEI